MATRRTVHFCHGLESGPRGFKATELGRHYTVHAPDMSMSLWNPLATNGFVRNLIRAAIALRWPSPTVALTDSFEACVGVQRTALATRPPADVLVGSSWGGAVAAALIAEGAWRGPAILLCPALHRSELPVDHIVGRLAALPCDTKAGCLIVHGTSDTTIPIHTSRALANATGIALLEVDGGSHGLGNFVATGLLRNEIEAMLSRAT